MGYKVVIASEGATNPTFDDSLAAIGATMIEVPSRNESDLIEYCHDADAVLVGANEQFNARVIGSLERCRVLSRLGIGYNNIDVAAATAKGIPVSIVPDYCVQEVADHAMSLVLSFARQIVPLSTAARTGKWQQGDPTVLQLRDRLRRLSSQTLGIVGLGRIGQALASRARAFGFRMIANDPYLSSERAAELGVTLVRFDVLLQESDYISLHAVMNQETRHLFNLETFKKMKRTAYLINTGRGGLVDEAALHTALVEGYLAGAGLDVTDPEPPLRDNPLLCLDNVLVTDHSSYYSHESAAELWQRGIEAVVAVLKGGWPRCLANPELTRPAA